MEWKIIKFEERLDRPVEGVPQRYKRAIFTVDGDKHSLRISMPDFDQGKAPQLVEAEAKKIMAALEAKGNGQRKQ